MAIRNDLELWAGEDVILPFDVDEATTSWQVTFTVKRTPEDTTAAITQSASVANAAEGYLDVALSNAQTAALAPGVYVYELCRVNAGAITVLSHGSLTVHRRLTS